MGVSGTPKGAPQHTRSRGSSECNSVQADSRRADLNVVGLFGLFAISAPGVEVKIRGRELVKEGLMREVSEVPDAAKKRASFSLGTWSLPRDGLAEVVTTLR